MSTDLSSPCRRADLSSPPCRRPAIAQWPPTPENGRSSPSQEATYSRLNVPLPEAGEVEQLHGRKAGQIRANLTPSNAGRSSNRATPRSVFAGNGLGGVLRRSSLAPANEEEQTEALAALHTSMEVAGYRMERSSHGQVQQLDHLESYLAKYSGGDAVLSNLAAVESCNVDKVSRILAMVSPRPPPHPTHPNHLPLPHPWFVTVFFS